MVDAPKFITTPKQLTKMRQDRRNKEQTDRAARAVKIVAAEAKPIAEAMVARLEEIAKTEDVRRVKFEGIPQRLVEDLAVAFGLAGYDTTGSSQFVRVQWEEEIPGDDRLMPVQLPPDIYDGLETSDSSTQEDGEVDEANEGDVDEGDDGQNDNAEPVIKNPSTTKKADLVAYLEFHGIGVDESDTRDDLIELYKEHHANLDSTDDEGDDS